MKERPDGVFFARFLGGYSLNYDSREIRLDISIKSKGMQIFLLLLKAADRGVSREELLRVVQAGEDAPGRSSSNLRQQIYLLRKAVARADLPPGRYIVLEESRYYFSPDYQVETDTGCLDRLLARIRNCRAERGPEDGGRREKEQELLLDFCRHYTGEFLPMLDGEEWATVEAAYYQNCYSRCLNRLCGMLRGQGDYETMLELSQAASQIHPYDEWQTVQIESLMRLRRYQEAWKVYEDTVLFFDKELVASSVDRVAERYRQESGEAQYAGHAMAAVKAGLRETEKIRGAYECSYPSFLDVYHILRRNEERLGMENTLMVAALAENGARARTDGTEGEGGAAFGEPEFGQKMELLRRMIREGTRSEDIYTHYSGNQYLVLLTGAKIADGRKIARRLEKKWQEISGDGGVEASFAVYTLDDSGAKGCLDAEEGIFCAGDQPGGGYMARAGDLAG